MDLSRSITQWLLNSLDVLPVSRLQHLAGSRTPERLLDLILGNRNAAEIRALLDEPANRDPNIATVLLPGVMGSLLASTRGISTTIWFNPTILLDGQINLLELDENGERDRSPDVDIVPVGIEKMSYLKLILTLARETRLYEFPYDWRRPLEWNAHILADSLQRWSQAEPERHFALVGHSMGGMLAHTYAALYPKAAEQLAQIITLATPFYGSPLTIPLFSCQTDSSRFVQALHQANDVVSLFANVPSTYQLLPPPRDLYDPDRNYPANWDLYDADAWGLSVVRQDYLDLGRQWHQAMAQSDPQLPLIQIAGCHHRTLSDIWQPERVTQYYDGPPDYTEVHAQTGADSGDGTVPLWSAIKEGVHTLYIEESHQALPTNSQCLKAVTDLLHGQTPDLPTALPRHKGLLEQIAPQPLAQQVEDLRRHIEEGGITQEEIERIAFSR